MKFFLLSLCLFTQFSHAAEETIVIRSSSEDSEIEKIPQQLMAIFVDQKFKMISVSKNIYNLKVLNLRCDYHSRDALYPDYFNGGLPKVNCYVNADLEMGGKGTPVEESRYLLSLINLIEKKFDTYYTDCAMGGKCMSFIQKIDCTSDMNQDEMNKAFTCTLTSRSE